MQAQLQRGGGVPQPDRQGARLRRGPRHPRRQQGGEEEKDDDQEEYADDCPLLANCDDIWLQGYTTVPVEVSVTCLGSFFPRHFHIEFINWRNLHRVSLTPLHSSSRSSNSKVRFHVFFG